MKYRFNEMLTYRAHRSVVICSRSDPVQIILMWTIKLSLVTRCEKSSRATQI